ncbi:MAG: helix-turn-helix transcriptional regulator [Mycobacteriaceae bacterium]|nr:helix-turn-helix transcriptional regulator [Mycobacteriaceae bacterium]
MSTTDEDRQAAELTFNVLAKRCSSRPVLEHMTGKWGTLVIIGLREGPARFNELRRRVDGVSEKMLSQTLHSLERDGLVERIVHSAIPPRVEYRMTPLGVRVTDKLAALAEELEASMPEIIEAQSRYDAEQRA